MIITKSKLQESMRIISCSIVMHNFWKEIEDRKLLCKIEFSVGEEGEETNHKTHKVGVMLSKAKSSIPGKGVSSTSSPAL